MKITGLNTFTEDGKRLVGVTVAFEGGSLLDNIGQVVNAIEGSSVVMSAANTIIGGEHIRPSEAVATPAPTTRRTRGAAATPAPADAPSTAPADAAPATTGERRRRTPAAPAETTTPAPAGPVVITDADLSKAASNAAAVLTPPVVMAVMEFFDAPDTSNVKPMARQAFIDTLRGAQDAHAIIEKDEKGKGVVALIASEVKKLRIEDSSLDAAAKFLSELAEEIKLAEAEKAATA
jgi:hypothetical protein